MKTDQSKTKNNCDQFLKIGRRVFLVGVIASSVGCQNIIRRGQSADEPISVSKYADNIVVSGPRQVGEICGMVGLDSVRVYGISLATELKGTGSAPIESGQREHLQRELKLTNKINDIKTLMADKNTELVIIEGRIPPGAQEGDRFDLRAVTMSESDATSIENGVVLSTRLRRMVNLGNRVKKGGVSATAGGPLIVQSLISNTDQGEDKLEAVIPAGGKATEDRVLGLQIQGDEFNQKTALQIAHAINKRFRYRTAVGYDGVAEPRTDRKIGLKVPQVYRNNIGRYASVLNQVVFAENRAQLQERLAELEAQIGQPAQSGLAAIQLEAIGEQAQPVLQAALSHNDREVRFHASEALAYMGITDGISELVTAAKTDKSYRWHAFAALASMESRDTANVLSEFFNDSEIDLRYGAFKAIGQQNKDDPIVTGDYLANEFFLHEVDSTAEPTICISTNHRAEIVIFGSQAAFNDNFLYVESGLTIKSTDNGTLALTAYSPDFIKEQRECTNQAADLIRTLADLGYGFSSQFKILRQASENGSLNAELAVNPAPTLDLSRRKRQRVTSDFEDIKPVSGLDQFINWIKPIR